MSGPWGRGFPFAPKPVAPYGPHQKVSQSLLPCCAMLGLSRPGLLSPCTHKPLLPYPRATLDPPPSARLSHFAPMSLSCSITCPCGSPFVTRALPTWRSTLIAHNSLCLGRLTGSCPSQLLWLQCPSCPITLSSLTCRRTPPGFFSSFLAAKPPSSWSPSEVVPVPTLVVAMTFPFATAVTIHLLSNSIWTFIFPFLAAPSPWLPCGFMPVPTLVTTSLFLPPHCRRFLALIPG